jgi:Tol biopolymer transport system component
MGADGTGQRRVTQRALTPRRLRAPRNWADDSGPAWSVENVIAFARSTSLQLETIYRVRPDGGGLRRLVAPRSARQEEPAWSPDGRMLAFTRRGGRLGPTSDVRVISADGTGDRPLTEAIGNISSAAWSPDGAFVCVYAFHPDVAPNNLVILRSDGQMVRVMREAPGNAPDWQPLTPG